MKGFRNKEDKSPETYEEFYMRIFVISMTLFSVLYFLRG